jgi:hypothetical protein
VQVVENGYLNGGGASTFLSLFSPFPIPSTVSDLSSRRRRSADALYLQSSASTEAEGWRRCNERFPSPFSPTQTRSRLDTSPLVPYPRYFLIVSPPHPPRRLSTASVPVFIALLSSKQRIFCVFSPRGRMWSSVLLESALEHAESTAEGTDERRSLQTKRKGRHLTSFAGKKGQEKSYTAQQPNHQRHERPPRLP